MAGATERQIEIGRENAEGHERRLSRQLAEANLIREKYESGVIVRHVPSGEFFEGKPTQMRAVLEIAPLPKLEVWADIYRTLSARLVMQGLPSLSASPEEVLARTRRTFNQTPTPSEPIPTAQTIEPLS